MNPFQNVSFKTVAELLDYLPPQELKIVEQLREIVFTCMPDVKEKLAYNVPFYYRHSRILYIWPSTVPWGGIKEGVILGFCNGHLLSDTSYLERKERKNVYTRTFFQTKEINTEIVSQLLYEAAWIDDEEKKRKGAKKPARH